MGQSGWIVLSADSTGRSSFAHWSPDGAYLIVVTGGDRQGTATLFTAAGVEVRGYDRLDHVAWVDSTSFLLLRRPPGDVQRPYEARLATVLSGAVSEVQLPPGYPLSNGHGAVAFRTLDFDYAPECGFGCPIHGFSVWQDGEATRPREGLPIAWSGDGNRLFVLHDTRDLEPDTGAPAGEEFIGWLEVLALPDLASVSRFHQTRITDAFTSLDPTGRYLLYETSTEVSTQWLSVLDTIDGSAKRLELRRQGFAWDGQRIVVGPQSQEVESRHQYNELGYLESITPRRSAAQIFSTDGSLLDEWPDVGGLVSGSADGAVVAFSDEAFSDSRAFLTVFTSGARKDVEALPIDGYIAVFCMPAWIAPGGDAVAVGCTIADSDTESSVEAVFLHPL